MKSRTVKAIIQLDGKRWTLEKLEAFLKDHGLVLLELQLGDTVIRVGEQVSKAYRRRLAG